MRSTNRFACRIFRAAIRSAGAALLLSLFIGAAAWACNVPVFRWALERWGAQSYDDCYRLIVFHEGPLKPEEEKVVAWLKESAWPEKTVLNLTVEAVDLAGELKEPLPEIWKAQENATLPWLVLRYPERSFLQHDVWSGPFSRDVVKRVVDSPLRRTISKRILDGEVAVWVFLESGDKEKDDAAVKLLEGQLKKLEKLLEIPKPPPGFSHPEWGEPEVPDLKVAFSTIRLSKKDPAEEVLHKMLIRSEEDLEKEYGSEPMAFPVFGRGRALYALVGKGITEENIEIACSYLVGMCSCEIKWQNPGTDLLFWTDWDAHFIGQEMGTVPLPELILPTPAEWESVAKSVPEEISPEAPEKPESPVAETKEEGAGSILLRNTAIALVVLAAAILGLTLFLNRRFSRS